MYVLHLKDLTACLMSMANSPSAAGEKESSSPQGTNQKTPTQTEVDTSSILSIARRVDAGCKIVSVLKAHSSTLIKINTSQESSAGSVLALANSLRGSFPFATVMTVENYVSGATQIQMLLHTYSAEMNAAVRVCRDYTSMRVLRALSNVFAFAGACSYATLLYATAITKEV